MNATRPLPNPLDFWGRIRLGDSAACWIWDRATTNSGYGKYGGRSELAHRIAYRLVRGEIPAGMHLDHLCRTKLCVNPSHLEVVTPRENTLRSNAALGTGAARTHCPQGHGYTPENTYVSASNRRSCRECSRQRALIRKGYSADEASVRYQRSPQPCEVSACEEKANSNGLCKAHDYRRRKYGAANAPLVRPRRNQK